MRMLVFSILGLLVICWFMFRLRGRASTINLIAEPPSHTNGVAALPDTSPVEVGPHRHAESSPPKQRDESEWQGHGYTGLRWFAAAKLLSDADRKQLADITPGIRAYNATSTWNSTELRWEEDFYGYPGKTGRLGPRAVLPLSEAVSAYSERVYGKMKKAKLSELRKVPGFVVLPPGASIGHPYGGDDAVWDLYYEPRGGPVNLVVRGHVGGVQDQSDSFTSRSLLSVPSKGFRRNDAGSSSGFTAYLVPHDMSEPVTEDDDALRPYAEYRKQRAEDLARRRPAPHASLDEPRDGYVEIGARALLVRRAGAWTDAGKWELRPEKPPTDRPNPNKCIIQWGPGQSNHGTLWCFQEGYWELASSIFGIGRTTRDLMTTGPLLEAWQTNKIRESLNNEGPFSATYAICPIVDFEPWPQAVYDENTVMGTAGDKAERATYYGWDKK